MILSDGTIRKYIEEGSIKVDPYDPSMINPASMDFRLGPKFFKVCLGTGYDAIDPRNKSSFITEPVAEVTHLLLPGEFILGHTLESLELPDDIAVEIKGKSSLGRLGLANSDMSGWIDPGWPGVLTIEIYNHSNNAIQLTEGMKIGQFVFYQLDQQAEEPYRVKGRYANQEPGQGSKGV